MKKKRGRPSSRARILEAASELAYEVGAGNISLDAVAERAGISKGGLLYNFPTKISLLRALVANFVEQRESQITELESRDERPENACIRAVIEASCISEKAVGHKPSGVLAAIAEDPQLIDPIREHVRRLVDRLRSSSPYPECALIAFLALEGLHSLDLFEVDALTEEDRRRVIVGLRHLVERNWAEPAPA